MGRTLLCTRMTSSLSVYNNDIHVQEEDIIEHAHHGKCHVVTLLVKLLITNDHTHWPHNWASGTIRPVTLNALNSVMVNKLNNSVTT